MKVIAYIGKCFCVAMKKVSPFLLIPVIFLAAFSGAWGDIDRAEQDFYEPY